jgi:YVTN family beta-propeller protein
MNMSRRFLGSLPVSLVLLLIASLPSLFGGDDGSLPFSPTALAFDVDSRTLVVAEQTGASVVLLDERGKELKRYDVPGHPSGLCSYDGDILLTIKSGAEGYLLRLDLGNGEILSKLRLGQGARSPVVNPVKKQVYVCNYFENDVSVVDLDTFEEVGRVAVPRMPAGAVVTLDGSRLFVTNFLPDMRADLAHVASKITVIDADTLSVLKHIALENGSNGLRDIAIAPDGSTVYVTHNLGRYQVPTTQLERGWMATNALSVIDVASQELEATVLLDEMDRGAAGSWGVSVSPDSKYIYVAHSGTHDISVIDRAGMQAKIGAHSNPASINADLGFLVGLRKRFPLGGNGPREILAIGNRIYVGEYFSDSISILDVVSIDEVDTMRVELNPNILVTIEREGEILFNDASHCFQMWQSCNSCHPDDVRGDGLNWDILNDGLGNPKNVKSLVFSHVTPPTTITGCRANAEVSVRAGFKYIQFAEVPEEKALAMDAYLKSLRPEPSPYLRNGELSEAAKLGEELFQGKARCSKCHKGEYLTDMKMHDLHNAGPKDKTSTWDTPTLREVWRTGPYMHDGRAATLFDVLKQENHNRAADRLSEEELLNLVEYVRSL